MGAPQKAASLGTVTTARSSQGLTGLGKQVIMAIPGARTAASILARIVGRVPEHPGKTPGGVDDKKQKIQLIHQWYKVRFLVANCLTRREDA